MLNNKRRAVLVLAALVVLGVIIWWPRPTEIVSETSENEFDVHGYYEKRSRGWYDDYKEHLCDSFYVLGGDDTIIDYFRKMVMRGNTVNQMNSDGKLIINLDLSSLSPADVDKIKSSNSLSNITLRLKKLLRK